MLFSQKKATSLGLEWIERCWRQVGLKYELETLLDDHHHDNDEDAQHYDEEEQDCKRPKPRPVLPLIIHQVLQIVCMRVCMCVCLCVHLCLGVRRVLTCLRY